MQRSGGQLFSYLQQEPDAKAICLYTSKIENNRIIYKNLIVENRDSWKGLNQEERFLYWNKEFKDNGIFEENVNLFKIETKSLQLENLIELSKEDGNKIYINFLEILRHNCVSDKPNAFNKMMNLFLCKITDENEEKGEAKFQVKSGESDEEILSKLNDLYNKGMKEFLKINILDLRKDEIDKIMDNIKDNEDREKAKELFNNLRIKKSQEFNFIDIYNDDDFKFNTNILKEIIEIIQPYRLRYTQKHQFLGDFFEKLLNDSLKQEAGQFFTPTPICEFIIKSIPIDKIIKNKIQNREIDFLPYTIDFACGTGHFLTEYMEEVQNYLNSNIDKSELNSRQKEELEGYKIGFNNWAKDYVYGIDKDKRLIKASKIACFLNGDGEANLIGGDGLGSFSSKNKEYYKKLISNKRENENFDLVISNPPYSVKAFKNYVIDGENSFDKDIFDKFTSKSSEIEVLFVERMRQLLKIGGIVGIILPTSLFTNKKLHKLAREIILKNFRVIAIVDLGASAFMATGTKTTILFLQKIDNISKNIENVIEKFFSTGDDLTSNEIEKVFSKYCNLVYNLELNDYLSILKLNPTEKAKEHDIYREYIKLFDESFAKEKNKNLERISYITNKIREVEKEKLLYFILSYNHKIVLGKAGEKDAEKSFYGYEFSNRKGHQGIKIYRDGNSKIISKMFSEYNSTDDTKLNFYILKNFTGKDLSDEIESIKNNENHELKEHIDYCRLWQLMNFENAEFNYELNFNNIKNIEEDRKTRYSMGRLMNICEFLPKEAIKEKELIETGEYPVVNSGVELYGKYNDYNNDCEAIIISSHGENAGVVSYLSGKFWAGALCYPLKLREEFTKINLTKYIYYCLKSQENSIKALAEGATIPFIQDKKIKNIKLSLPPREIQEKIVEEIEDVEKKKEEKEEKINRLKNHISGLIEYKKEYRSYNLINELLDEKPKAGGDMPKNNFSLQKTEKYNIPIYANEIENNGLLGYTNVAKINKQSITVTARGTIGHLEIRNEPFFPIVRLIVLTPNQNLVKIKYLYYYMLKYVDFNETGAVIKQLTLPNLKNIKIQLPDLETQNKVVEQIEIIEKNIETIKNEIVALDGEKNSILDKYLYE